MQYETKLATICKRSGLERHKIPSVRVYKATLAELAATPSPASSSTSYSGCAEARDGEASAGKRPRHTMFASATPAMPGPHAHAAPAAQAVGSHVFFASASATPATPGSYAHAAPAASSSSAASAVWPPSSLNDDGGELDFGDAL